MFMSAVDFEITPCRQQLKILNACDQPLHYCKHSSIVYELIFFMRTHYMDNIIHAFTRLKLQTVYENYAHSLVPNC